MTRRAMACWTDWNGGGLELCFLEEQADGITIDETVAGIRGGWHGCAYRVRTDQLVRTRSVEAWCSGGVRLHLTNPKAILFFLSLYSLGVPPGAPLQSLLLVFASVGAVTATVCLGYAWLFASRPVMRVYARARGGFDLAFAACFAVAAILVLVNGQG